MGPLTGKKIIEIKGIGPGPYAGMLLADLGADVLVIERSSKSNSIGIPSSQDICSRGKKSIILDLKAPEGVEALLKLVESADAIFEGFRPGVVEKLGIGPDDCLQRNPKIVYGRITGWGQTGPLSHSAGHDFNYISLTGVAAAVGTQNQPIPPLNIIGDYAAGSLFLVVGILSAIIEASQSGKGQVVDTAITDGSAHLMSMFHTLSQLGFWNPQRQSNMLDGGSPFYRSYETADAKYISVAPLEPHFFAEMIRLADLPEKYCDLQNDPAHWPTMQKVFAERFRQKTRDEWVELFEGSDACVAGILDYTEAHTHPHNVARQTYIEVNGQVQPAPAPKFSRSEVRVSPSKQTGEVDNKVMLAEWGLDTEQIDALFVSGAVE